MALGPSRDRTVILDTRRARELYQYVQVADLIPGGPQTRDEDSSNHSAGLGPYCQLVALRCRAAKVLLNVMDKDTMYSLSDASTVATANDIELCEDPVVRTCSGAVPLEGRVCETTIRMTATGDAHPMFVVNDLSNSPFRHLDVVSGHPYYRFYAGTPITTRDGVNIGSLAFLDTRAREGLTQNEEQCLGRAAAQVMSYLEINRQAIEGRRAVHLARSLDYFIVGKESLISDAPRSVVENTDIYGHSAPQQSESTNQKSPAAMRSFSFAFGYVADNELKSDASEETGNDSRMHSEVDVESRSHSHIFGRAANLLRQGFGDMGQDCSVVFVTLKNRLLRALPKSSGLVKVIAASTSSRPFLLDEGSSSLPLQDETLGSLIQHYPDGCLFVLGEVGSSSEEEDEDNVVANSERKTRKRTEVEALRAAFPHAHQLLFAPLWDSDVAAYVHSVFVTNSADDRSLSATVELSFLNSFCSSVATECTRVEAKKEDKQKSDFVGTISHEMRSPLHGILASVEFMTDTSLSNYQQSLIDTVQSCGRTLLDTIDHVLDFSKINTFRKNWQAENKRTRGLSNKKRHFRPEDVSVQGTPVMLQLTCVVDIGVVLEEVVDALVLGQTFASTMDITDLSPQSRGRSINNSKKLSEDRVHIFIDVQNTDWAFVTQPGAIRRIVLNLAANALKYTTKGQIIIRLELSEPGDEVENAMILTVMDTGKGIGPKFLECLMYVPFAQENPLAPGTGLGLSIVHNIVTMLGGTINIQSKIGEGTTAKAVIPLRRPLPGQVSTSTTPQSGKSTSSHASHPDDTILSLRNEALGSKAMIYRPQALEDELGGVMRKYVRQWYGLHLTDQLCDADVIIAEEDDLDKLIQTLAAECTYVKTPAIVILCSITSRHDSSYTGNFENSINGVVEWMSMPMAPHKLAKSIRFVLQRSKTTEPQPSNNGRLAPIAEQSNLATPDPAYTPSGLNRMTDGLQEIDLNTLGESDPAHVVQASESISVSQTSQNAQKAITSPEKEQNTAPEFAHAESFPFPTQEEGISPSKRAAPSPSLNQETIRMSSPKENRDSHRIDPLIMVVDDNKINSSLLKTFLTRKRKFTQVDCAENGQEAIDLFTSSQGAHKIVFMDISMPIVDGFEATRAIRDFEKNSTEDGATGTMVIALTGLASSRDQAEAFEAGIDVYLTKPTSLRAVGDLLDSWELHQRMSRNGT